MTKRNKTILYIVGIIGVVFVLVFALLGGEKDVQENSTLGAINRAITTISNPFTFQQGVTINTNADGSATSLTVSGGSTLATTTVSASYDGFMIGGGVTPSSVATSTVFTLYTHTGGPAICDASKSAFYADSTAFSPSLVWSVGTSTTAIASTNLIASSTVATTTDTVLPSNATSLFVINVGNVITAIAGDITNTNASSTYYGNWDVEYAVACWSIGG